MRVFTTLDTLDDYLVIVDGSRRQSGQEKSPGHSSVSQLHESRVL